jgi:RimJ/RimL family protein N-acetyltransferase
MSGPTVRPDPDRVVVRPVGPRDRDRLLAWANDPETRSASFSGDQIASDEHRRWLARRLSDPAAGRIWVGRSHGRLIGVVRVDRASDGSLVVGVALDRGERGKGRSRPLLEAGLAAARAAFPGARFRAWIRPENAVSLALFSGAGFEPRVARPSPAPRGAPPDVVVLERD